MLASSPTSCPWALWECVQASPHWNACLGTGRKQQHLQDQDRSQVEGRNHSYLQKNSCRIWWPDSHVWSCLDCGAWDCVPLYVKEEPTGLYRNQEESKKLYPMSSHYSVTLPGFFLSPGLVTLMVCMYDPPPGQTLTWEILSSTPRTVNSKC